jgi:acyl-coenzyme A thioesterase PaaI-like protein
MKKGGSLETEILKLGQRLVVGRITIKDNQSDKLAAEISCTYARL